MSGPSLFPVTTAKTLEERTRERIEARGGQVVQTDRKGIVAVVRGDVELGALTWREWARVLDEGVVL